MLFGRCTACCAKACASQRLVGQTGHITSACVDADRRCAALTHHDRAGVDHGGLRAVGDAGGACTQGADVGAIGHRGARSRCGGGAGAVGHAGASGRDSAHVRAIRHLDAVVVLHSVAGGDAASSPQIQRVGQIHLDVRASTSHGQVGVGGAEVHLGTGSDVGTGGFAVGTNVPAGTGQIRYPPQLRHIDSIRWCRACSQVGNATLTTGHTNRHFTGWCRARNASTPISRLKQSAAISLAACAKRYAIDSRCLCTCTQGGCT